MTRPRWIFVGLAVAALALGGCASKSTAEPAAEAITIEEQEATGLKVLTLSEKAAERLGVETAPVAAGGSGMTVPYAAIVYDADGKTWAYVNSEGLTYQRAPVTVDEIEGDVARLSDGPPEGTPVVTIGAAELYGAEIGVGGGH
jgi:hypothetical protein